MDFFNFLQFTHTYLLPKEYVWNRGAFLSLFESSLDLSNDSVNPGSVLNHVFTCLNKSSLDHVDTQLPSKQKHVIINKYNNENKVITLTYY